MHSEHGNQECQELAKGKLRMAQPQGSFVRLIITEFFYAASFNPASISSAHSGLSGRSSCLK